jgi:hypothetical protein
VALRILLAKNRFRVRGFLTNAGVAEVCQLLARPIRPRNRTSRVRAVNVGGSRRAAVAPAGGTGLTRIESSRLLR